MWAIIAAGILAVVVLVGSTFVRDVTARPSSVTIQSGGRQKKHDSLTDELENAKRLLQRQ